jgi:hypothetical protein
MASSRHPRRSCMLSRAGLSGCATDNSPASHPLIMHPTREPAAPLPPVRLPPSDPTLVRPYVASPRRRVFAVAVAVALGLGLWLGHWVVAVAVR